jgi:hypothetical protein
MGLEPETRVNARPTKKRIRRFARYSASVGYMSGSALPLALL